VRPRASRAAVFWSFAAIYVVWGSTYLAIRVMVTTFPPFLAAGTRFLVAGALLYGWARWRGVPAPERRLWPYAVFIGALFFLFGNGGVTWAETRLPSGLTALLAATSPLFTAVFESARGGWHRPDWRVLLAIIAGLGGVALLVAPGEFIGGAHADFAGAAVLTFAALTWAAGSVISHARPLHPSAELATGMKMLAGGVLLVLTGLLAGEGARVSTGLLIEKAVLAWVYLVIFGSLIGFSAFTYLLRVTTPQKVTTSAFVNPLVAVALGWLLLGETITPRTLVAAAIIVGAVVLIRVKSEEPQEP
jgi:drug/metabolite transporter (DMT)-like permease